MTIHRIHNKGDKDCISLIRAQADVSIKGLRVGKMVENGKRRMARGEMKKQKMGTVKELRSVG